MRHAAGIRVIGDKDIARLDVARLVKLLNCPLDGLVQHTDKGRDASPGTGQFAVPVGDARSHVEHLVDDGAHGRAAQGGEHLVGSRLERALDDLQRYRIVFVSH